jgi:hypothetical protein
MPSPNPRRDDYPRYLWQWVGVCLAGVVVLSLCLILLKTSSKPASTASSTPSVEKQQSTSAQKVNAAADLENRWKHWLARLNTAGQDTEIATELDALVSADPARALASRRQVAAESRLFFTKAVLCLWADNDPAAAATAALNLPEDERSAGVEGVLIGSAKHPEQAIKLAYEFCRSEPAQASLYGSTLVNTFAQNREYRSALRFATSNEMAIAGEDCNKWLKTVFAQWASQNLPEALAMSQTIIEKGPRFEALDAIAASRVQTDSVGIAETLRILPPGEDRTITLGQTLRTWVNKNPKAAADWIDRFEPNRDFDPGVAAVATEPYIISKNPEVALSWAESIVSAELRSRTLTTIIQKWATTNLAAATRYAQSSSDLLPEDRVNILGNITKPSTE